jgi:thiosulfate dehydrogenase
MRAFVSGFGAALLVLVVLGVGAVYLGLLPARADDKPSKFERRVAHIALNATIAREEPKPPYPFSSSPAAVLAGAKLYMAHCSACHGNASGDPSVLARGLNVDPPQFGKDGVDDDPEGETYWKIEHGIRFTGMPSFKGSLSEEQIWQIAFFLKIPADQLPAAPAAEFRKPLTEPNETATKSS